MLLLIVDDEFLVLEMLRGVLEEGGFEVETACTADEALAKLEELHQRLSGVITDIHLGAGATGWEVARRARELRGELPIVYVSAHLTEDWPVEGVPHSMMVPKPFAPAQVVTAISTLMNKAASQPGALP